MATVDDSSGAFVIDEAYEFSAPRFFNFIEGETAEEMGVAEVWFDTALAYAPSRTFFDLIFLSWKSLDNSSGAFVIDEAYEFLAPRFFDFIEGETAEDMRVAELWFDTALDYAPSPCPNTISRWENFIETEGLHLSDYSWHNLFAWTCTHCWTMSYYSDDEDEDEDNEKEEDGEIHSLLPRKTKK